ncbi:MAG: M28 family peptidase [Myxococcota bacterium]
MRWRGPQPPRTARDDPPPTTRKARARLRDELEAAVRTLASDIGERHLGRYPALCEAAEYIARELRAAGHAPRLQRYRVRGRECDNLEVEIRGKARPEEIVVVGAHYDSANGSPGANDNATGVAAVLALARRLPQMCDGAPARTVRLVAFTNEELPHAREGAMGSVRYARRCRHRRERIVGMLSLETMGYYSDLPGSQSYPLPMGPFYPRTGSFIGFVGNLGSLGLVRRSVRSFRRHSAFPCRAAALPGWVPGVAWSDHASFWAEGYPAVMVTDTAPFRYPHYHRASDTPDKVDYDRLALVTEGLFGVVRDEAS